MDKKTCTRCGESKPLDDFAIHTGRKSGRRASCKACNNLRGDGKDWTVREKKLMDQTKAIQDFLTTYRVNGGECADV